MANDPGPSTWLAGQYEKFLEGVELTGNANAARLSRSEAPVRTEPGKAPQISIPAWDDIVRLGPRLKPTEEEYAIHRHFERAGLPSPLSPELQQAIEDRREMAKRIRNSAIPEYQRGVSTMMTAVDNVQDAALTTSVAGRIAVTALGRFGGWIAPAVGALSSISGMLGWLGLGLTWFGVAYALACQGPRDALAQYRAQALAGALFRGLRAVTPRARGIPTPIATASHKGRAGIAMFGVPSGRDVANRRQSRWARAMPSFGELLQIGQVAYDQLGYGLALGGIVGMSAETAYADARRARGEPVAVRSPSVNHTFKRIVAPRLEGLGRAALWHRQQSARAVASSLFLLRDPGSIGDELYGLTWVVLYAALEPLMWDTEGLHWREPVISEVGAASWEPWDVHDPITRGVLLELGLGGEPARWPVPGAPATLSAERIFAELGPDIAHALARWLAEDETDPYRRFVAEMSTYVLERIWVWLEGATDYPGWTLSPSSAVWESLFFASRWPIVSDPPERILGAWAASEQYARDTGRHLIAPDVLDRIWAEHGSPLLRLHGGDGPVPPEFLVPYDPATGTPGDVSYGQTVAEARERLQALHAEEARQRPQDETSPPA